MAGPEQNGENASSTNAPPKRPEAFGRGEPPKEQKQGDGQSKEQSADGEKKDDAKQGGAQGGGGKGGEKKQDAPPKKPFWQRPVLLTVMISVTLVIVVGSLVAWLILRHYEETDDAYVDGHIIHVAPRVAGRVLSLNVNDNQAVDKDTVVINIDPADFQVALERAQAAEQQAEAQLLQSQANLLVAQASAEQAEADVTVAQANAINAESTYQRYQRLPGPARSQQEVDQATADQRGTAATVIAQQKRAASMQAQVEAAKTNVGAAQAAIDAEKAAVAQAELNLKYCNVTAGQAGYITRRTVEAGNYVQVGQEMLDVVPRDVWCTANFKETQLTDIKPGQPVWITVDAFPQHEYQGKVDSLQAGSGEVFSVLPPENATGNFVKIVQRVPVKVLFTDELDHNLAPGMSCEASVRVR